VTPLLTTEEVADLLRVDEKTVRTLVDQQRLRPIRLSKRSIRFNRQDVELYRTDTAPLLPLDPADGVRKLFGTVYFVGSDDYVKIGFTTKEMPVRMKHLQTGNPVQLKLLHATLNTECGLEKALHRCWAAARYREEWFRTDVELLHPSGDKITTLPKFIEALAKDEAETLAGHRIPWGRKS
jgi:excisionase family DNA binding protein